MKAQCFVFFLAIMTCISNLYSQEDISRRPQGQMPELSPNNGLAVGKVVDRYDNAIQYASIYLMKTADTTTVGMSISDENGRFIINPIPYGSYFLRIIFMGYAVHNTTPFEINDKNRIYRPGSFVLSQSTSLDAVEISAKKDMIQTNLDKRVYNVESSIIANGATAIEILQDIPSVSVDMEGNISLRGSENVTILVDGHPTNLTLDQIPASQIETIEVITNPSARLEPDGMAGILNVVLKKKKERGFNGMATIGAGPSVFDKKVFLDNYNGNISLNYSYNKINIFLNYDYRHFGRRSSGDLMRTSWFDRRDSSNLYQSNSLVFYGQSHNVRTGLDWFINSSNTLNFSLGFNYFGGGGDNTLFSNTGHIINNEALPYQNFSQIGTNKNDGYNYNANISYLKKFKTKGQELSADIYFSQRNGNRNSFFSQNYSYPEDKDNYYQRNITTDLSQNASAQVDFITPAGKGGRIETGYKSSLRTVGQDYYLYDGNDSLNLPERKEQSNNFEYKEWINALYFIYSNTFWKKLQMQLGIRGELSQTLSDLKTETEVIKSKPTFNAFPSAHLRYDFNTNHSLQFSYSMRVSRPRIMNLNPFIDKSDQLNWRKGNPFLKPEFANSFELGYLMIIKKSTFNANIFYRQRNNIVSRYTKILHTEDENGDLYTYTLTSYENLNKSQNFGFELMYGQQLWKFWRINFNADFYRVIINSDSLIDENLSRDWAYGFRLNQTFSLPKNWDIQLNFRFRSPSITTGSMGWGSGNIGQGKQEASYNLDLGIKKAFLKKALTVSLNFRNLIYNRNNKVRTWSYEDVNGYDAVSNRKLSNFQINLTLSFKINRYQKHADKHSGDELLQEE